MAAVLRGYSLKKKFILFAVFAFLVHGASDDAGADRVSVSKGDSVILHTNVKINQGDRVKWYFNDIRIALISGDLSDICTDVQCNEGTERFRDRLKLDHQTGSLTIRNINTTDAGVYQLRIFSNINTEEVFDVVVYDVPAADMKRKSVTEGESVTLDTHIIKTPNDTVTWYFNDTLIAEVTGDQSKICKDDQCDERFRDRLKLDHQIGSLTITNTRRTDSGVYHLQIKSSRNRYSTTSIKSFTVSVTDSGLSSAAVAGICVAAIFVLLVFAVFGVIYYCCRSSIKDEGRPRRGSQHRAQMSYCAPTFHPLPESESETE